MSIIKLFEVRDRGTCMPVLAIRPEGTNDAEHFLWNRAGYGGDVETQKPYILLCDMSDANAGGVLHYDRYHWDNRTLRTAHDYIAQYFDTLESGQVIDVEFILSETKQAKKSERRPKVCRGG